MSYTSNYFFKSTSLLLLAMMLFLSGCQQATLDIPLENVSCSTPPESINNPKISTPELELDAKTIKHDWTITRESDMSDKGLEYYQNSLDISGIKKIKTQYIHRLNKKDKLEISYIYTDDADSALDVCKAVEVKVLGRHTLIKRGNTIYEMVAPDNPQLEYQALQILGFNPAVINSLKKINKAVLKKLKKLKIAQDKKDKEANKDKEESDTTKDIQKNIDVNVQSHTVKNKKPSPSVDAKTIPAQK